MLCGVTATLGSNPSATATAARPHWGRAVLLCLAGVPCGCVAPRVFRAPEGLAVGPGCCVCPWAAARPRAVRAASFARRVVSKPGQAPPPPAGTAARPTSPSGALHTSGVWSLIVARRVVSKPGQALPPPINFARNSPAACSSFEYISLELQRFWGVSKNDRRKLCATFGQCGLCCRLRVLGSDSPAIHALVIPEAVGVLHYTKPAGGVSPACRTLV